MNIAVCTCVSHCERERLDFRTACKRRLFGNVPAVPVRQLSTGEIISEVEFECRNAWLYAALLSWHADPANATRQSEIARDYVAAMQRDPKLD